MTSVFQVKIPVNGSHLILQENIGNHRNPEAVFYSDREMFGFFPMNSSENPVGSNGNRSEINGKTSKMFPVGILLPNSGDFRSFPAESGRTALSCVIIDVYSSLSFTIKPGNIH